MSNTTIHKGPAPERDASDPADSVYQECLKRQENAPRLGAIARMFGRSPLSPSARGWYDAALGDLEVARSLERMGSGWTVMHTAGAGSADSRVDMVAIGRGGVFAIVTKPLVGANVFVSGNVFTADGVKLPLLRIADQVATHASDLIEEALRERIAVTPVIVVAGASSLSHGSARTSAKVLQPTEVARTLQRQPHTLSEETVARVVRVASLRGTLHRDSARPANFSLYRRSFELLQHQVEGASHRSRLWASAGTLVALMALTELIVRILPALAFSR
jgi:hypothetical protein